MTRRTLTLALFLIASVPSWAGRIVVNHDEWTTSNTGYSQAPAGSANAFVTNVASFLTAGAGTNILVYSNNFSLTQSNFLSTLTTAGYTVTSQTTPFATFDLASIQGYQAIFLAGNPVPADFNVLAAYVNAGGGVYVAGGTASVNDQAVWNPFLNAFGLNFGPNYNGIGGVIAPTTGHPIFNGVARLYYDNGNTVSLTGGNPNASIVAHQSSITGPGLIGVYDLVPEPSSLALMTAGLIGVAVLRRRRR